MPDIPGNSSTTATVSVGSTTGGTLEVVGDHDWYRISLTSGQSITVTIDGTTLEDPYLYIRNSSGNLLYQNDDISPGVNTDSRLSFTATYSGNHYIDVGAWNDDYAGDYQVIVAAYTPPPLATYDQIANHLVSGYWDGSSHHFNVTQGGSITVNLSALTPSGQTLARAALAQWSDVIGVSFPEVSTGGQIQFDDDEDGAFAEYSWSGGITTSAHVNVSTQWLANYGTGLNSYSFQTYIHEIGHALGLGHAGNYNGAASYPYDALFQNDSWAVSVMSYFSQAENTYFAGQGFTEDFVVTPMVADILAMSQLYGLSTTTRTGDTTYGSFGQGVYNATIYPSVALTIFDSGGTDSLDYSSFSTNQLINLNPETFSNVALGVGNLVIARGVVIENATGGSGNDILIGNNADNVLTGGGGNDQISASGGSDQLNGLAGADAMAGGSGNDTYIVDNPGDTIIENPGEGTDAVQTNLGTGATLAQRQANAYQLGANVENLTGTGIGQGLRGNGMANVIVAGAGDDFVSLVDGGADTVSSGNGRDVIYYGAALDSTDSNDAGDEGGDVRGDLLVIQGDCTLTLGAGSLNDIEKFRVLKGENTSFGDTAGNLYDYSVTALDGTLGVGVRLVVQGGSLQLGEHLTFNGSAELDGSFQIFGGHDADTLSGGAQDDHLLGRSGDDTLNGNGGADRLRGGLGGDTMTGGSGADIFIYAAQGGAEPYPVAALESTGLSYDTIIGFSFAEDKIDLPGAVSSFDNDVTGALNDASFDADLASAVNSSLAANGAVLFTADSGDHSEEIFLVVDADGNDSYQAGLDFVIYLQTPIGTVPASPDFFM